MSITIYILKLVDDCFYVGKTNNMEERFFQHTSGKGSLWTKIHRPIKIEKTFEGDIFDEDKTVKHVSDKIKKPINKNSIKMVKVLKK